MLRAYLFSLWALLVLVLHASDAWGAGSERSASTRPVAVVLADAKFDDNAAVWSLLRDPQYSGVVVVTSGVVDHGRAAAGLWQFLGRQTELHHADLRRLSVLSSDTPLAGPAPHEEWYRTLAPLRIGTLRDLPRVLAEKDVALFQIAPTSLSTVQTVIANIRPHGLQSYMLLHGYNSRQLTMQLQESLLKSLRPLVRSNNPAADVYFTSSFQSYAAKNGGKQLYRNLLDLYHPANLDEALKDPFWSSQLSKAREYAGAEWSSWLPTDLATLDRMVYDARRRPQDHGAEREALKGYIRAAMANNRLQGENQRLHGRLRHTLLPEFAGETTVELADAAHIAMFHRFRYAQKTGTPSPIEAVPVIYPMGRYRANDAVGLEPIEHAVADGRDGLLLIGGNSELDLQWLKAL